MRCDGNVRGADTDRDVGYNYLQSRRKIKDKLICTKAQWTNIYYRNGEWSGELENHFMNGKTVAHEIPHSIKATQSPTLLIDEFYTRRPMRNDDMKYFSLFFCVDERAWQWLE